MRPLVHKADEAVLYRGPDAAAAFERAQAALFAYRFYEPIVTAPIPGGVVTNGMVIEQRIKAGLSRPLARVKVTRVWDEPGITTRNAGFTYEALPGHPERGIASFAVIRRHDEVLARIESDSAPNVWYAKLLSGMARRLQDKAVRTGLANLKAAAAPASSGDAVGPAKAS